MLKPIVRGLRVGQFVLAVCIFTYAALMPASVLQTRGTDTLLHFSGNVLLFLSAWLAGYGRISVWLMFAMLVPYSLLIEMAQLLTPSRVTNGGDMLTNTLGLLTGLIIAYIADRILVRFPKVRSYLTKHPAD